MFLNGKHKKLRLLLPCAISGFVIEKDSVRIYQYIFLEYSAFECAIEIPHNCSERYQRRLHACLMVT